MIFFRKTALYIIFGSVLTSGQNLEIKKGESQQDVMKREVSLAGLLPLETPTIFRKALLNAKLPGGVVIVNCDDKRKSYVFTAKNISLEKLFSRLEQIDPQYETQWKDGVLNLMPEQGSPQLLNTLIKEFDVSDVTAEEALGALKERPEVIKKMAELGLNKAVTSVSTAQYFQPDKKLDQKSENARRFDLHLKNATFRQILNEIVKAREQLTWVYLERHCNEINFSVIVAG